MQFDSTQLQSRRTNQNIYQSKMSHKIYINSFVLNTILD